MRTALFAVLALSGGALAQATRVDYPLAAGTRWTYDLRQEAGPGVHFGECAGCKITGNVLEAPIVSEVGGTESIGGAVYARVESKRAGTLWLTEWLRVTDDGLLLGKTFDTDQGQEIVMTPPQRLLSAAPRVGETWNWKASDAPVSMAVKVEASEAIRVPAGSFDTTRVSYLMTIKAEVPGGAIRVAQTRWFAPGTGFVKQSTETSVQGRTLTRVALDLRSFQRQK